MSEALNNLNDEYKQMKKEATSKEEKQQIKQDYKEMKTLIKGADKLLQKHDEELKKFDKVWDKLDKEYQKLGEAPSFEEIKEELDNNQQQFEEQKKHSEEVIQKANEMIKQIDEKLAELEKKESLENNKQDYNNWKNEVLARINSEEYSTIEEAKERANSIIKNENDLTSVWEKNQKYYVVLSRDREVAFRNNYKEILKYDDLTENIKKDGKEDIKITLKEYISSPSNNDVKLSFELYSKHFLPTIKPHTIFYENKELNDENKYSQIIKIVDSNIETIKKLNLENISSFKGGLQEIITIQLDNDNYFVIGNTDNQEMKQLYKKIKEDIINVLKTEQESEFENDRNDYFAYKQGDIQIGNSQCDFCRYKDSNNITKCIKYPDGKPNDIINTNVRCEYLELSTHDIFDENDIKKIFEKDSTGAYIRLIIPHDFVCLILPKYKGDMDLKGKKDLDLSADEVIVLKKYAYELSEKNRM